MPQCVPGPRKHGRLLLNLDSWETSISNEGSTARQSEQFSDSLYAQSRARSLAESTADMKTASDAASSATSDVSSDPTSHPATDPASQATLMRFCGIQLLYCRVTSAEIRYWRIFCKPLIAQVVSRAERSVAEAVATFDAASGAATSVSASVSRVAATR